MKIVATSSAFLLLLLFLAQGHVNADKVKVDVYYETLCPDSIGFLLRKLIPNYEAISSMVQLNLIPFGKAEIYEFRETIDFYCQHGHKECRGNTLHACVLNDYRNLTSHVLPFFECMEYELYGKAKPDVDAIARKCAKEKNLDWAKMDACASGAQGKQLLMDAGKKTKALRPKLSFVPTIVINEKYSDSNQNKALYGDFVKLICNNYSASPKPEVCSANN